MTTKFFIIIPIYNVESYLHQCLDSILNQTYSNFEAILINDGSTDSSFKIAQDYADKNERFILISQTNQGLSITRNNGLKFIKEKLQALTSRERERENSYICFFDSDDYLQCDALEILSRIATKTRGDIIMTDSIFRVDATNQQKDLIEHYFLKNKQHYDNIITPPYLIESLTNNLHTAQQFIFKASFLLTSQTIFIPNIIHEDNPFLLDIILQSKTIYINPKPFYNYRSSPNSITRSTLNPKTAERKIFSYWTIIKYYEDMLRRFPQSLYQSHIKSQIHEFYKSLVHHLKFFGYPKNSKITKEDLLPYAQTLKPYKRLAIYFPKLYGFPRKIKNLIQNFCLKQ